MGINGILPLIRQKSPHSIPNVSIPLYAAASRIKTSRPKPNQQSRPKPRISVDVAGILYNYIKTREDWLPGLYSFFSRLHENFVPVVVFDGAALPEKLDTAKKRKEQHSSFSLNYKVLEEVVEKLDVKSHTNDSVCIHIKEYIEMCKAIQTQHRMQKLANAPASTEGDDTCPHSASSSSSSSDDSSDTETKTPSVSSVHKAYERLNVIFRPPGILPLWFESYVSRSKKQSPPTASFSSSSSSSTTKKMRLTSSASSSETSKNKNNSIPREHYDLLHDGIESQSSSTECNEDALFDELKLPIADLHTVLSSRVAEYRIKTKNVTSSDFKMVKEMLDIMHIIHCTAPQGMEAEGLCAYLAYHGHVDGVMSQDSDIIAFLASYRAKDGSEGSHDNTISSLWWMSNVRGDSCILSNVSDLWTSSASTPHHVPLLPSAAAVRDLCFLCGTDYNQRGKIARGMNDTVYGALGPVKSLNLLMHSSEGLTPQMRARIEGDVKLDVCNDIFSRSPPQVFLEKLLTNIKVYDTDDWIQAMDSAAQFPHGFPDLQELFSKSLCS